MARPHVVFRLVACLMTALTAAAACLTALPVPWDRGGRLGALALSYPLHLLLPMALCISLALYARSRRARVAAGLFGLSAALAALLSLVPTLALGKAAARLDVRPSLGTYLVNAARMNYGLPQPDRSVSYGVAAGGTELFLDVWLSGKPNRGPLRPAIVLVHGGAWAGGHRSMAPDWNRWLNELGYEVFDVEYRSSPPARFQDEVGDVKAALAWVAAQAAKYHVDPARISVMGASAGGNLALLAAYGADDPRLPPSTGAASVAVRSVINLYGPADLASLYRDTASKGYVQARLDETIGGGPERLPDRYRLASPLSHVTPRAPPTITLLGTSDRLVPGAQVTALDEALSRARVPHESILLPASDHAFDINWGSFATQLARARIQAFLRKFG